MKLHPNGDRTLLPGTKNVKKEKAGTGPRPSRPAKARVSPTPPPLPEQWATKSGSIMVPVELPLKAHALLTALALDQGHGSVGGYLLALAKNDAAAVSGALAHGGATLEDFFALTGKEAA